MGPWRTKGSHILLQTSSVHRLVIYGTRRKVQNKPTCGLWPLTGRAFSQTLKQRVGARDPAVDLFVRTCQYACSLRATDHPSSVTPHSRLSSACAFSRSHVQHCNDEVWRYVRTLFSLRAKACQSPPAGRNPRRHCAAQARRVHCHALTSVALALRHRVIKKQNTKKRTNDRDCGCAERGVSRAPCRVGPHAPEMVCDDKYAK